MNERESYLSTIRRNHGFVKGKEFKTSTRSCLEQTMVALDNAYTKFQNYHMEVLKDLPAKEVSAQDKIFAEAEGLYTEATVLIKEALLKLHNLEKAALQKKVEEKRERELEAQRKIQEEQRASGSSTSKRGESCAMTDRITRFIRSNKFDGSYVKWNEWQSSYEGLVHKTDLSAIEKFHTLKQSLTGDAASIISGWQVIAENYESAYKALSDVYNNRYRIIMAHFDDLAKVERQPNESYEGLRQLIDTLNRVDRQLRASESVEKMAGYMMVHQAVSRMAPKTLSEWENYKDWAEMPTLNETIMFLERRARSQLNANANIVANSNTNVNNHTNSNANKKMNANNQGNRPTRAISPKRNRIQCHNCGQNHVMFNCQRFKDLSIQERRNRVATLKLCFMCLAPGHSCGSSHCKGGVCRRCNKPHNSLLCFGTTTQVNALTTTVDEPRPSLVARSTQSENDEDQNFRRGQTKTGQP